MMQKTVAFCTLGCKVNQVDSESMRSRMAEAGHLCVDPDSLVFPDVVVVNSCAVTAESERDPPEASPL
jgi:threonylcarbamoyladenosine tRNA methylthiotransferase MtaB